MTFVERVATRFRIRQAAVRILEAFGINDFNKLYQSGRKFVVVSAYRAELGKHENQTRHGELVADLQRGGYHFDVIKSSWVDMATGLRHKEKSLLVWNMPFDVGVKLMEQYKQDAIVYKDPSNTIGIYVQDGRATMAFEPKNSAEMSVLRSTGDEEYSKGRGMSFGLQLVEDREFRWSGGPITREKLLSQLAA